MGKCIFFKNQKDCDLLGGFYYDFDLFECKRCHFSCKTCFNNNSCSKCQQYFYFNKYNKKEISHNFYKIKKNYFKSLKF
jgi:hypothetical protein